MKNSTTLERIARNGLHGIGWYEMARHELREVAQAEGWHTSHFADVIAITSPRVTVRRNVRLALQVMIDCPLSNMMTSIKASVEAYYAGEGISGPKTAAFARALQGCRESIVLDVHMANALDVEQRLFRRAYVRAQCERRIRNVAERLGVFPVEAQEAIWFGQKLLRGENPEPMPLMSEYRNWLRYDRAFPDGSIEELSDD